MPMPRLPKPGTIAHTAFYALLQRPYLSDCAVLDEIKKRHPGCKTTWKGVAQCRCKFKKYAPIPSAYEVRGRRIGTKSPLRLVA